MVALEQIRRPSKSEQKTAVESCDALASVIRRIESDETVIEIKETKDKIKIPVRALKLLSVVLKAMSQGKPISIETIATEVTTQKAAEILGCSRPHLVKLLDENKIAYTKVGKHRRIRYEDVISYKHQMKQQQKQHIIDIMDTDEEAGLYDS